jgi:hypothetical protein
MNFRKKEPTLPADHLDQLDRALSPRPVSAGPTAYAPPHIREYSEHPANTGWRINGPAPAEPVFEQIETFGALPTKELDDIIAAAEANLANLKRDAQAVRDLYAKHTARIIADVKRLHQGVNFSVDLMNELREKVLALDSPPANNKKKKEEPHEASADDSK